MNTVKPTANGGRRVEFACAYGSGHVEFAADGELISHECVFADPDRACIHLGAQTGERPCPSCSSGGVRVKVFACAVHGSCTIAKNVGAQVCAVCPDKQL